jgi:uncharacterized membrane protein
MSARTRNLALAAAFVVGLGLRLYHFGTVPKPLQTADEYAWTWAGMSLLHTGVPRSWSYLDAYPTSVPFHFGGQTFKLVSPWLDHPPLFALLMGGWMRIAGYPDPAALSLVVMRCVPLAFWMLSFGLLAMVLARLFEAPTVILAMIVFATAPPAVMQSKLVIAESVMVPLALVAFLILLHEGERKRAWLLVALAACALVLPLLKVAALSLSAGLLCTAARRRNWPAAATIAVATAIALGLYLLYGAHFGWRQFEAVQQAHSGRFVGFNSGLILLVSTHIVDQGIIYPLFLLALVGAFVDVAEGRGTDLYLGALVYAGCMTFFADQRSVYGWYWIPLYPALACGAGSFIARAWRRSDAVYPAVAAVVITPWIFNTLQEPAWDHRQQLRFVYAAVMLAVAAITLLAVKRRATLLKAVIVAVFGLQLGSDLFFVLQR